MGLSKSTVSTFCKRNELADEPKKNAQKSSNYLISGATHGNTSTDLPQPTTLVAEPMDLNITCKVTVSYFPIFLANRHPGKLEFVRQQFTAFYR